MKINIFWLRRDLRLEDNTALNHALEEGLPVLPVFIFDINIIDELPTDDPRISFIYYTLSSINSELRKSGSSICILKGDPVSRWKELTASFDINAVYVNKDYEPYAISRDKAVEAFLREMKIPFLMFKDQVIFEEGDIVKSDNKPYTVFTPYKKRWLQKFTSSGLEENPDSIGINYSNFLKRNFAFPALSEIGFRESTIKVRSYDLSVIDDYDKYRDFPAIKRFSE